MSAHRGLRIALGALLLLVVAVAALTARALSHPDLAPFRRYEQHPSTSGAVTAQFLGTTSLLLRDSATTILADGFVSRPGLRQVLSGKIAPDTARIAATLRRLGVGAIAAVFTGHSHYDHALDAPEIARRTGAVLLGSTSTANVGRGGGLSERQIRVVRDGETVRFGAFALTFVESRHSVPDKVAGTIDAPLVPPAKVDAWKTGTTWSVFVEHGGRTLLVHGSPNYRPGALRGRHADVVYLGAGTLSKQSDAFVDAYWNEVVRATGARRVILVHWDDFWRTLDEPLVPLPRGLDDFGEDMRRVLRRASADGVEVLLPVAWQPTDPFAGLPPSPR